MTDDYFIGVHARELGRLREQHLAWQPETQALWQAAGFGPGQTLADLGCGPGFSTLELARAAGPSGKVAAIDKARPFLDFLGEEARRQGIGNIRTRQADLSAEDALAGPYDGVFCRWLLAFLVADLDGVLARIHRSLKPGGVLAAMEYLTLETTTCSPPLRGFDAHTQGWIRYYERHGGDTAVGSYLPAKLAAAGFEVTFTNSVGGIAGPSHPWWGWWGRLMEDFGDKLVAEDLMSAGDLQHLRREWARASKQEDARIHTPMLVQVVARKKEHPLQGGTPVRVASGSE
jgi:ubiquinone/menaquinone biosynthesis C-methylase UbiE